MQAGTNGFTCFIGDDGTPECDDQNAMEWRNALGAKQAPPDKIGFIYMLAGNTGNSNHDASQRHTHQHWVQTGPHVMIVGGSARERLSTYPRDEDVKDPTQPFVMFPGKANEHLMVPVHNQEGLQAVSRNFSTCQSAARSWRRLRGVWLEGDLAERDGRRTLSKGAVLQALLKQSNRVGVPIVHHRPPLARTVLPCGTCCVSTYRMPSLRRRMQLPQREQRCKYCDPDGTDHISSLPMG